MSESTSVGLLARSSVSQTNQSHEWTNKKTEKNKPLFAIFFFPP